MKSLLQSKGLFKYITDRFELADNPEKLEELLENDERALGMIKRNIDLNYIDVVSDCGTALDAWTKLEDFFAGKENFNLVNLLQQLTLENMKQSGNIVKDIQEFIQSKNELVRRLGMIGFKVEEKMQIALMLAQLPPSFESMRRILESKELSLSLLISELHRESVRKSSSFLKRNA